jgi:biotin carboxyl carrier protein
MERLELLRDDSGSRLRLCSPLVGWFTCALGEGAWARPGVSAGVLETLGVARELVVPEGTSGRVVSPRPERVHAPVGFGSVLYELEPLAEQAAHAPPTARPTTRSAQLVVRAPHSGRFWQRASPADPPFVRPGDALAVGQTIGLLEVMKTFSPLAYAAQAGLPERARVVALLAADGAEVRAQDPLLELERVE